MVPQAHARRWARSVGPDFIRHDPGLQPGPLARPAACPVDAPTRDATTSATASRASPIPRCTVASRIYRGSSQPRFELRGPPSTHRDQRVPLDQAQRPAPRAASAHLPASRHRRRDEKTPELDLTWCGVRSSSGVRGWQAQVYVGSAVSAVSCTMGAVARTDRCHSGGSLCVATKARAPTRNPTK